MNNSIDELRAKNEREFYSPFSRFMHDTLLYVTRPLLKTSITPNQITVFWISLQLLGSFLMTWGEYRFNVLGVSLYVGAALFDYVDGQIARIKNQKSYLGLFLEELGIYLGSPIFFLCFSIGLTRMYQDPIYFSWGVISALAALYAKLAVVNPLSYPAERQEKILQLQRRLSTRAKGNKVIYLFYLFRRSQPLNFLLVGILFNIPRVVLIVYASFFVLELVRRLWVQLRTLHHLDREER